MDGFDLAALDTLPHGLPGNAQPAHRLVHSEISLGRFFCDARAQVVGEANAPRSAGGELFSGNDAVVEPAVNGRSGHAERRCDLPVLHSAEAYFKALYPANAAAGALVLLRHKFIRAPRTAAPP